MYRVFTPQFDQTLTLANLWEGQPEDKMANLRAQMLDKADAIMPELAPLPPHNAPLTLLLDLSGSMRGYKIFHSIVSLIAVGRLLSAAGQTFQVLGFTTKSWKGGQARQAWLDGDKHPPSPGRLTVLRHIVIKDFDTDWSQMEPLVPILFTEGLLKDNVDGEALAWAAERQNNTGRVVLISDGEPEDESTKDVMGETYLKDHFENVVFDLIDQDVALGRLALGSNHHHIRGLPTVPVPANGEALTYAQQLVKCVQEIS
jgi:cobaltochelatase CobT